MTVLSQDEYKILEEVKKENNCSNYKAVKIILNQFSENKFAERLTTAELAKKIDNTSNKNLKKEVIGIVKEIKLEKNIGSHGGDMFKSFLQLALDKNIDPAAFDYEYDLIRKAILIQQKLIGIGAMNYLVHESSEHYKSGKTMTEKRVYAETQRGKNFRTGNLKATEKLVCAYKKDGSKILVTRKQFEAGDYEI